MKPYLAAVNGLRFPLIFTIVLHHWGESILHWNSWSQYINRDVAVSLFFVLSGFVLYYSRGTVEKGKEVDFIKDRLAKFYPLVFFVLFIPGMYDNNALGYYTLTLTFLPPGVRFLGISGVAWCLLALALGYILLSGSRKKGAL